MSSTVIAAGASNGVPDRVHGSGLNSMRYVYHHYYSSTGHSGAAPIAVVIGLLALVIVLFVVRKLMSSN